MVSKNLSVSVTNFDLNYLRTGEIDYPASLGELLDLASLFNKNFGKYLCINL